MPLIPFSRYFPSKHPRSGEPTYFVEAVLTQLGIDYTSHDYFMQLCQLNPDRSEIMLEEFQENLSENIVPKSHTIRATEKWKPGMLFLPVVWSGAPYRTKQIRFAPGVEVKKTWSFQIINCIDRRFYLIEDNEFDEFKVGNVANNDGLSLEDFERWFLCHPKARDNGFKGQIICWNENIQY